jgi:hypothetical protein
MWLLKIKNTNSQITNAIKVVISSTTERDTRILQCYYSENKYLQRDTDKYSLITKGL